MLCDLAFQQTRTWDGPQWIIWGVRVGPTEFGYKWRPGRGYRLADSHMRPTHTSVCTDSTSEYTLWALYRSYFKRISANIELQVYSVTCC
jgi:hypothetical protein